MIGYRLCIHINTGSNVLVFNVSASNIEQVLEVAVQKAAAVQPLTTHHENYPSYTNKTCGTLLEK